ncbi:hypothetical protein CP533_4434 [Ophiocordyceps camponoti-saundersi (nom. inval.)]|nr:hypothetical protein CP533_4434 [Ophiocordyceps camponoti-saundersi (nom. inval.)]
MATHGTGGLVGFRPEPNCGRGTVGILWSCFSTIGLSLWASLHLDLSDAGIEMRIGMFVGCLILPEAGVAIATGEYATALYWRDRVRAHAGWESWSLKHSYLVLMGGVIAVARADPSNPSLATAYQGDEEEHQPVYLTMPFLLQLLDEGQPQKEALAGATAGTPTTISSDQQVSPLSFDMFPSVKDINRRAKTDAVVKVLALGQALWFAANVVFRLVTGTGLSLLETMTVAYVLCGIVLYVLWFAKPQGLEEPFSVPLFLPDHPPPPPPMPSPPRREDPRSPAQVARLVVGILLVTVFSGIHLAAWNYPFATRVEAWLWRGTVLASWVLASLPALNPVLPESWYSSPGWYGSFERRLKPFLAIPYVVARLTTFVLVFTAFRAVPSSIYQQPAWSWYWINLGG